MSIGGPAFCSGEDITLELEGFDNDPAQISEVPWIIFYNEMPLTMPLWANLSSLVIWGAP